MASTLNPINVRPIDLKPGDVLGFKIVAVVYPGGFWAAYQGLTDWDDYRVATEGDKIDETTARRLFYALDNSGLTYNL